MSTRTRNKTKKATPKAGAVTVKRAKKAETVRPVDALKVPKDKQKSIRIHATLDRLPRGNGGVRFSEKPSKDGETTMGIFYVNQPSWALLGKPETITVDVKAA